MKLLIYPYSDEQECIVKCLIDAWDIKDAVLITPFSIAPGTLDGFDIVIDCDFDRYIEDCDTVLFLSCDTRQLHNDVIHKLQNLETSTAKRIISAEQIDEREVGSALYRRLELRCLPDAYNTARVRSGPEIQQPESIIIGTAGLVNGINSFPVIYHLNDAFSKRGYKVVSVSKDRNAGLFGFVSFPQMIFEDKELSLEEKVVAANSFVGMLEEQSSPDIILIDFPEGLMRYSDEMTDCFGIRSFILSQAVNFDYFVTILSSDDLENISDDFLNELQNILKYRFGLPMDELVVSDQTVDEFTTKEEEKISFNKICETGMNQLFAAKSNSSDHLYNLQDAHAYESIADKCIDLLSDCIGEL